MNNCLNCIFSRKKIDDLNINYEGTEKVICLRHMIPIEENYKCNMWVDQNKELKCNRCGKEIKFAIYKSKRPSWAFTAHYGDQAVEIYTGTDLCLDCHMWAEEQKEKIFGVGFDGLDSLF